MNREMPRATPATEHDIEKLIEEQAQEGALKNAPKERSTESSVRLDRRKSKGVLAQ